MGNDFRDVKRKVRECTDILRKMKEDAEAAEEKRRQDEEAALEEEKILAAEREEKLPKEITMKATSTVEVTRIQNPTGEWQDDKVHIGDQTFDLVDGQFQISISNPDGTVGTTFTFVVQKSETEE